jgi:hypothetical protein
MYCIDLGSAMRKIKLSQLEHSPPRWYNHLDEGISAG